LIEEKNLVAKIAQQLYSGALQVYHPHINLDVRERTEGGGSPPVRFFFSSADYCG